MRATIVAAAVGKLQWSACVGRSNVFHKALKSGCRAEQARLRTAERLVRLLAVFCILIWRVFWLMMVNRAEPEIEPAMALIELDLQNSRHPSGDRQYSPAN